MTSYLKWMFNIISNWIKEMWNELPVRYAIVCGIVSYILLLFIPYKYIPVGFIGLFISMGIGFSYGLYKEQNPEKANGD